MQATLATLQCQGARIDQLQFHLSQHEANINRRLALAGIFVGATTAVVAGEKAILEPFEVRIALLARDLGRLIEELLDRPAPPPARRR